MRLDWIIAVAASALAQLLDPPMPLPTRVLALGVRAIVILRAFQLARREAESRDGMAAAAAAAVVPALLIGGAAFASMAPLPTACATGGDAGVEPCVRDFGPTDSHDAAALLAMIAVVVVPGVLGFVTGRLRRRTLARVATAVRPAPAL